MVTRAFNERIADLDPEAAYLFTLDVKLLELELEETLEQLVRWDDLL